MEMTPMAACSHTEFQADVAVTRLEDAPGWYMVDVRVQCAHCLRPLQFRGLPLGLDLHGVAMAPDGLELRAATTMQGVRGFGFRQGESQ